MIESNNIKYYYRIMTCKDIKSAGL